MSGDQTGSRVSDDSPIGKRIREAIAAGDWSAAFEIAHMPGHTLAVGIQGAAAVGNWTLALELEEKLLFRRKLSSPAELPLNLARRLITVRLNLWLRTEALDLALEIADRHKHEPSAQRALIKVHRSLEQYEEALELSLAMWGQGHLTSLIDVSRCLIRLEEFDRCQRFLEEASQLVPAEMEVSLLHSQRALASASGDGNRAIEVIDQLFGRVSEEQYAGMLALEARKLGRADLIEKPLAMLGRWIDNPASRGAMLETGPTILKAAWECRPDSGLILTLLQRITAHLMSPEATVVAANIYQQLGQDHRARALLQTALVAFPSSPELWSKLLTLIGQARDSDAVAGLVADMKTKLPRASALAVTLQAMASTWPEKDLPELAEFAVNSRDPTIRESFSFGLSSLPAISDDIERMIEARVAQQDPLSALRLSFILRRTRDKSMLHQAVTTPVEFAQFVASGAATKHHLAEELNTLAATKNENRTQSAAGQWLERNWKLSGQMSSEGVNFLPYTAESFADAAALTDFIVERVIRREPASALRIGDCEAAFFQGAGEVDAAVQLHQEKCKRTWWGDRRPEAQAEQKMIADFVKAIGRADVLGIMPLSRLVASYLTRAPLPVHAAIENGMTWIAKSATAARIITSAHFHQDLHQWSLWDEIFAAVKSVSWISCHDLAPFLFDVHGLETNEREIIPAEQKYSGLFGPTAESECSACGELPLTSSADLRLIDLHEGICARLAPLQGEVWLVAAGFLGKIYCDLDPCAGLCCTNSARDSSRESSVIAGGHEQTEHIDLQDPELARI